MRQLEVEEADDEGLTAARCNGDQPRGALRRVAHECSLHPNPLIEGQMNKLSRCDLASPTCMPNTRLNTRPNYDPTRYAMVHESARTVACGVLID